ncbi:hypothetical protein BD410DRAFT_791907 [Rickenella mellea]|uniref:Uncharacterized protein n=1 Tax=Rickenella mellea TaxID=50990 RepID=A0A4Y7PXL1_9AGAM|nr:hypothetical protein BD410DRAFT_791907 [Rickenella mellea]
MDTKDRWSGAKANVYAVLLASCVTLAFIGGMIFLARKRGQSLNPSRRQRGHVPDLPFIQRAVDYFLMRTRLGTNLPTTRPSSWSSQLPVRGSQIVSPSATPVYRPQHRATDSDSNVPQQPLSPLHDRT